MSEVLDRTDIIKGLQVQLKRANLMNLAAMLLVNPDADEEIKFDFSLLPDVDPPERVPKLLIADTVTASVAYRTTPEDLPYAIVAGYPRFNDEDDEWVTSQRKFDPDDELLAEIVIPHQDSRVDLFGTMNVYLLGPGP